MICKKCGERKDRLYRCSKCGRIKARWKHRLASCDNIICGTHKGYWDKKMRYWNECKCERDSHKEA